MSALSTIAARMSSSKERFSNRRKVTSNKTSWPGTNRANLSTTAHCFIASLFSRYTLSFFRNVTDSTSKSTLRRSSILHRYTDTFRFFILRSTAGSSDRLSSM